MSDETTKIVGSIAGLAISVAGAYISNKVFVHFWVKPAIKEELAAFEARHAEVFAK